MGARKPDGTALTVTTQENAIKKTLDKRFTIPIGFYFLKHLVYPYDLKEGLFIRIELNSAGNVLLCTGTLMQNTRFQTFFWNMMQFLTTHMPQA